MTEREQQIFQLIKQDPMIPQQSIAEKLGISRSAVAGHIMNMTNKGIILGKGYILSESQYAVVIGGANMDILGQPKHTMHQGDSNPGVVSCSPGGVGRNIAENIARLGTEVRLISVVGNDTYGQLILDKTRQAGVDVSSVLKLSDGTTSTYLSLLNEDGDMQVAVSDMSILERLTIESLEPHLETIKRAEVIVIDTNLSESLLEYIFSQFSDKPIFVDTVSSTKAVKIKPYLNQIHTLKPNIKEAQSLSDLPYHNQEDLSAIADWFLNQGTQQIFLSLGAEGVFYKDDQRTQLFPTVSNHIENANGAGDAFLAGLAHSFINKWSVEKSGEYAMAAASVALSDVATINPNFSDSAIQRVLNETEC
ncbi:kinase [Vibrio sp. vnigr-6D03]|uniref:Carbohydrate kinase n=1 Tax=Vibrio penaeicida TaxID=104609 RepID=A0AAV5NPG2_9VIBR|nr:MULTISPECIES: PfkB family carbohydrate kinase [Vibrio]PKF79186.1 kinase [Vibrio sp. vnigr-6D03]RTZ22640.1 winged helix-turn-helix transcriptional regulator [Vibrio penaeicida]GLQ72489.1 carbohydrate kinase [Vibrio penaeicida]